MPIGGKRIYNESFEDKNNVILWDVYPVKNGQSLMLTFESKNSEWHQGVWLMCDDGIQIDEVFNQSMTLWYETAPKRIKFTCHTKNGLLNIYNIWDRGNGPNSQAYSSGMIVEDIQKGRRYKCNDIGFQTSFDKLVFRIEYVS
jgi:hypothetical protein